MGRVKLFQKCPHCSLEFEVKKTMLPKGGLQFFEVEKVIQKCPHCGHIVDIEH